MNDNAKNIIVTTCFMIFIFSISLANILTPDKEISTTERRKLDQLSNMNLNNFTEKFEDYSLDQFIGRDFFRKVKAYVTYNVFNQKDNNKIYIVDGQVSKYTTSMDESSVVTAAKKFNKLYDKYLSNMNVYYSIIPNKNHFIAKKNGYPSIDYTKYVTLMNNNMNSNMKYIDLYNEISINDYYSTDIHWRQEKLGKIVNKLSNEMNFKIVSKLTENELDNFYGNYYGQAALPIDSEKLIYLTNDIINSCKVKILNEETFEFEESEVYNLEAYKGIDPYDIFLSGAKPLIVIENDNANTDKELIIFRDSFGSSLAPLLIEGYKKITLIDLRYIATPLLTEELVEFKSGQDVLIINYTDVLNNSTTLKVLD